MAKFETQVAGVSFYDIDFASISMRSKVTLEPNPANPHDANAIKVIIDGRQVGHIPRSLNTTLKEYIARRRSVTARVARLNDPAEGRRGGIAIAIVVDGPSRGPLPSSGAGDIVESRQEDMRVCRATASLPDIGQLSVTWQDFFESKKSLPRKKELPSEPDYHGLYKNEVPLLQRLLKDPEPFFRQKREEWLQACQLVEKHNEARHLQLKALLSQNHENEFWKFEREAQIAWLFDALNISLLTDSEIEDKRQNSFVTVYEEFIFQSLKRHYPLFRQVAVDGHNIDFLVVLSKPYRLWAIEVDGGIHRRQAVAARDRSKEAHFARLGIHLIRVSNRFITKAHRQAVDQVLEVLRQA